jgi:hypothetical protein
LVFIVLRPVTSNDQEQLRATVAQLSSQGRSAPSISKETGVPGSVVRLLLRPACPECGAPMSGKGETCRGCSNGSRRMWGRQEMLDARDAWAAQHGKPPSSYEWSPAHAPVHGRWAPGRWPGLSTVQREFGTWPTFLSAPNDGQAERDAAAAAAREPADGVAGL